MRVEIRYEIETQDMASGNLQQVLANDMLLMHLQQAIDRMQQDLDGILCRVHNQPPLVTVTVLPENELAIDLVGCCDDLVRTAQAAFDRRLVQTAYFQPGMQLLIYVEDQAAPLTFDFYQIDTLVIGRSVNGEDAPDVDLADFNALERGISRRHALLFWRNGTLNLADEGSANGTILNGRRLPAHKPHILRNGDRITLGGLSLTIELRYDQ